jgi:hypothetical protein
MERINDIYKCPRGEFSNVEGITTLTINENL